MRDRATAAGTRSTEQRAPSPEKRHGAVRRPVPPGEHWGSLATHLPASARMIPVGSGAEAEEAEAGRTSGLDGRKSNSGSNQPVLLPADLHQAAVRSGGRPLRTATGPESGARLHAGTEAAEAAAHIGAQAYTVGSDIVFGAGRLRPDRPEGQRLLVHELVHVAQHARSPGAPAVARRFNGDGDEAPAAVTAEPPSAEDLASAYEADAWEYFSENMEVELRNAAAIEGAAIGRRASSTAAERIRSICEPFERDQETDTRVLNTVFALSGGAANLSRGVQSGPRSPSELAGPGSINIASRMLNVGLSTLQVWMPTLAGYHTVGELKDAAVRALGAEAQGAMETTGGGFQEYEDEVMSAMHEEWEQHIADVAGRIRIDAHPQFLDRVARAYWNVRRAGLLAKLRADYGSRSAAADSAIGGLMGSLEPRFATLREHLHEVKSARQMEQAITAITSATLGGAALGAGIGVWAFGAGALPGALIGAGVGLLAGGYAAVRILSD
jgi:hypothetical protein